MKRDSEKLLALMIPLLFVAILAFTATASADSGWNLPDGGENVRPIFWKQSSIEKVNSDVVKAAENKPEVPVIVMLEGNQDEIISKLKKYGAEVTSKFKLINAVAVTLPSDTLERVADIPQVNRIALDRKVRIPRPENKAEPLLDVSGPTIGSDNMHDLGITGENVDIAVLDTGIAWFHPTLENKLVENKSFVTEPTENDPMDYFGHGTHVAGIAAGRENTFTFQSSPKSAIMDNRVIVDENYAPENNPYTKLRIRMYNRWPNENIYYKYDFWMENESGALYQRNGTSENSSRGYLENTITFDKDGNGLDNFENAFIRVYTHPTEHPTLLAGLAGWDSSASTWENIYGEKISVDNGVAPDAKLWNVKVLNAKGYGYLSHL